MAGFETDVQASLAPEVVDNEAERSITSRNYALETPRVKNLDPTFSPCLVSGIKTLKLDDIESPISSAKVSETPRIFTYTPLPIHESPRSVPENYTCSWESAAANIFAAIPACPRHDSKMDSMIRSLETSSQIKKSKNKDGAANHVISFKAKEASVKLEPETKNCPRSSIKPFLATEAKATVDPTQDTYLVPSNSAIDPSKPQQDATVSNHEHSFAPMHQQEVPITDLELKSRNNGVPNKVTSIMFGKRGSTMQATASMQTNSLPKWPEILAASSEIVSSVTALQLISNFVSRPVSTGSRNGRPAAEMPISVTSECLTDVKIPSPDTPSRNDLAVSVLGTGSQFGEDHNEPLRKGLGEAISLLLPTNTDAEAEMDADESRKTTTASGAGEYNSGNNSSPAGNAAEFSSSPPNNNQKGRKRRSGGGGSSGDGDGEGYRRPAKNTRLSDQIGDQPTNKRLACTFWLHDPLTYRTTCVDDQYSLCAFGTGFEGISKLKEHLRRNHPSPTRCGRCKSTFKTQVEVDTHLEKAKICELREVPEGGLIQGMTPKIEEQLKDRKKYGKKLSEEEQAREIYRLLFPGSPDPDCVYRDWSIPTPASDQEHRLFWNTLQRDLPQKCRTRINTNRQIQNAFPNPEDFRTFLDEIISELNISIIEVSTRNRGLSGASESDLPSTSYIESTVETNSRCGDHDCTGCPTCGSFPPEPPDTTWTNNASRPALWNDNAPSTDSGYNSNPVVAGNSNVSMDFDFSKMTEEEWKCIIDQNCS